MEPKEMHELLVKFRSHMMNEIDKVDTNAHQDFAIAEILIRCTDFEHTLVRYFHKDSAPWKYVKE